MSQITTHVLDTARGKPATGLRLTLARRDGDEWIELGAGVTDADGRVSNLLAPGETLPAGRCKLTFDTGGYHHQHHHANDHAGNDDGNVPCFYPQVEIQFSVAGDGQHYHVPLLLSPFGYSTYRGS